MRAEDIAPFLDELELNAKELGIKGEVVSVDSITTADKSLYLNIRAEGTFDNLYKFLKLLENYKYELEIVDFKILKEPSSDIALGVLLISKSPIKNYIKSIFK